MFKVLSTDTTVIWTLAAVVFRTESSSLVGLEEGVTDGVEDGLTDGVADGFADGLTDGVADGFADGLAEGFTDGLADGVADGFADGLTDGVADGFADGLTEGVADGLAEGLTEGVADGIADGVALGESVPVETLIMDVSVLTTPHSSVTANVTELSPSGNLTVVRRGATTSMPLIVHRCVNVPSASKEPVPSKVTSTPSVVAPKKN